jgi:imidazolonepropionase
MSKVEATLVIRGASEVATMASPAERERLLPSSTHIPRFEPARGAALGELGLVPRGAVAVSGERIAWVGPEAELDSAVHQARDGIVIDAAGGTVLPGFVDPHTHLLFAGDRSDEFGLRVRGRSYQEITAGGGGILASVRAFRAAPDREILDRALHLLDQMLQLGSTTVEVKSGYGLATREELRALELAAELDRRHPVDVIPTFLGAHAVPPEYHGEPHRYLELLVDEMLPAVASQGIARFCDVFCEPGFFSPEESRTILVAAGRFGLGLKLHADEFVDSGGAALAAELGAVSADHLMAISDQGVTRLAASSTTIPVLLPGTSFFLGMTRFAPGRRLADEGLPVAVATDLNPGSSMVGSMPLIVSLACLGLRLTPEEALVSATRNAACAAGARDRGLLAPGALADLQVVELPKAVHIPYCVGPSHVRTVVKRGRPVVESGLITQTAAATPPRGGETRPDFTLDPALPKAEGGSASGR